MPCRKIALLGACAVSLAVGALAPPAVAQPRPTPKVPVAAGYGGAVATVDADATRVGIDVLRRGGNAVDAAVAAAAALGVTEPYSAGVGGGGFLVYYDARSGRVHTIDGREESPAAMTGEAFVDPATGQPYPLYPQRVTSGVAVGVPGTPLTWDRALRRWGTTDLAAALRPATRLARSGFVVDQTFHDQTAQNADRFDEIPPTAALFLPGGQPPPVGSVFRNPALARTYDLLARQGVEAFYSGPLAREVVRTVRHPPVREGSDLPVPPGSMTTGDLASYTVPSRRPTRVGYRGLDVYGMAPPSSGGSTVGEALNILERFDLEGMTTTDALHHYLEASALAFADRNAYVGDPDQVDVPLRELLSDGFAAERACEIDPDKAAVKPVAPGEPDGDYATTCDRARTQPADDHEGLSTTHLTVADRWGNIVSYTLTIEQTGGSGITVPGRGFLLNNELTDFSAVASPGDPNSPAGDKRPRSSMSPTIVLDDGRPVMALGSPGGSTIITTVLQTLVNRLDLGMTLPDAVAAPRASQRNTSSVVAEPAFVAAQGSALGALGHSFSETAEIGAATGIEILGDGLLQAVAEPSRRGGGSAAVVRPAR